jgi:GR25 family glycosyltransferase involved in LPS biosynthesis
MKSFVITVMERPDSITHAQACVQSCKSFGILAELHAAHFLDAGVNFLHSKGISIRNNLIPRLTKKMSGRGVIGCFASHYSLWEKCLAQSDNFLILEEDALMIRKMPEFFVDSVLNLDPLLHDQPEYLQSFWALQNQQDDRVIRDRNFYFDMTTDGEAFHYMYGAYAYLITPGAARTLVRAARERGYLAADVMVNDKTVAINCVTKSVFLHRPRDYSLSRIR